MARDRIKSRVSFKSEVWTGKRESARLARVKTSWPCLLGMDFESTDLESRGESGLSRIGGTRSDSELVTDIIASESSIVWFAAESPVGSKLPYLVVCSESEARVVVGVVNPSKIKSPRISMT